MIEYIEGNLLDFPNGINVIAHVANCKNCFGGGIALQIKNRYPKAYEADCKAAEDKKNILGKHSHTYLGDGKFILNVYAQENYGTERRQLNYEAFYSAFNAIRNSLEKHHEFGRVHKLGVPKFIGCVLAGGSWLVVEAMLKDLFLDSPVALCIVDFKQNKK